MALAKRILAGEEVMKPLTPPLDAKALSDREITSVLIAYLTRNYGFSWSKPGFAQQIKFADLPPELRTQLMLKARESYLQDYFMDITTAKFWLDDNFWTQARLKTRPDVDNGKPLEVLMVRGPVPNGMSTLGIGALEDHPR